MKQPRPVADEWRLRTYHSSAGIWLCTSQRIFPPGTRSRAWCRSQDSQGCTKVVIHKLLGHVIKDAKFKFIIIHTNQYNSINLAKYKTYVIK